MKPLLNTLYVTTPGAYLSRDGETICVEVDRTVKTRVPIHTLCAVVCFGHVMCTPYVYALAASHGVALAFLTETGRFLARVQGPISGNVFLRRRQYQMSDDALANAECARAFVAAKIANCRSVLLRGKRDSKDEAVALLLQEAAGHLKRIGLNVLACADTDTIRGHEGEAASLYFGVFDQLIACNKDGFFFRQRSRRPPLDNMNALLSFLYTLLTHDIAAALECVGLDPQVGFLHRDRPGRPSLALDMAEELRPVLADRLALSMINRRQLAPEQFKTVETGGVVMDDDARKQVLVAWQKRKQEEILHPLLQERIAFGLVPHVQALLLARHVRGDVNGYLPFYWNA